MPKILINIFLLLLASFTAAASKISGGVEHQKCLDRLEQLNYSFPERLAFCNESEINLPGKVSALLNCHGNLQDSFTERTKEICLEKFADERLQSSEILTCFHKTQAALDPDFISTISKDFLFHFLEDLKEDCTTVPRPIKGKVRFHSSYFFATRELVSGHELGGLSGLIFDSATNRMSAISDQKILNKGLIFNFELVGSSAIPVLVPTDVLELRPTVKNQDEKNIHLALDMEGIARDKNGNFFVSSETLYGHDRGYIRKFSKSGMQLDSLVLPKKFYPHRRRSGIQANKGFEGLGLTPDGEVLFTANEAPLMQDLLKERSVVRLITLKKSGKNYLPMNEHLYELEKTPDNGIVEIIPRSKKELLTLERGFDSLTQKVTSRLFKVRLENAPNVSQLYSLKVIAKDIDSYLVKKELLLDLDTVIDQLPAGLRRLDNIEGMTLGPLLPSGKQLLILVSDNNLNPYQTTQFIFLEI